MSRLVELARYLNLVAFTALALAGVREWRSGRGPAASWAALAFASLALVVLAGNVLSDEPGYLAQRTLVAVLLLFPYLLYRFASALVPSSRRLERALLAMAVVLVVWTFALPDFPEAGEPRSGVFVAYLAAFLAHWGALSVAVATTLWRAGTGQPTVSRRRMRSLSAAAAGLTVAIFVAAAGAEPESGVQLAAQLLALGSAVAFLLALSPPWLVRTAWRRPEQERLQTAVGHLMRATSEEEVAAHVLEPMARLVGARAIALFGPEGRLVGARGLPDESVARLRAGGRDAVEAGDDVERVEFHSGSLVMWTARYAPFFGSDERALLRTLGDLTGLALDRTRLFAQEREARAALERADSVKSNFVALAAHELRAPVSAVYGIGETLYARGPALPEDRREELTAALHEQAIRLRLLVEQLLDLSRLDADAITISPEPLRVRDRVEDVVAGAVGTEEVAVEIDVPPELEAPLDPAAFDRIVSNLVANALRYGSAPISVTAELRDRHFRLAVEDRGPGVPSELVPDLFERFTRGAGARAGGVGTGLGLAIARSYAQAHDGDLLYEPAQPHGSRFLLVLPAASDVSAHVLARA